MKLLATITIWLLAVLLAGLLILRLVRGRPTLVRSAVGRRAIRIAAMVLVFTGTSGLVGGASGQEREQVAGIDADGEPDNQDRRDLRREMDLELEIYLDALPAIYTDARLGRQFGQCAEGCDCLQSRYGH